MSYESMNRSENALLIDSHILTKKQSSNTTNDMLDVNEKIRHVLKILIVVISRLPDIFVITW